jgi:hypothetical protein
LAASFFPALRARSWAPKKSQVEGCKYQDYSNIHKQSFQKPIFEEHQIYPDNQGCHCQHVKPNSDPAHSLKHSQVASLRFAGALVLEASKPTRML